LDSSITDEKAAEICSNWLAKMYRSWSSEFKLEEIANSAFNCVWREDHLDGSPINATDDCIAWLRHIYWKDEDYPYEGKCDPKKPVLQYSFYDDSSESLSQNPGLRLYFDNELEMLEDLLTEMTKEPISVEVSMELVSLKYLIFENLEKSAKPRQFSDFSKFSKIRYFEILKNRTALFFQAKRMAFKLF
jgi:RNAse (barnase) inhibitor barstar